MQTLDFKSLDKEQVDARDQFILRIEQNVFVREEFDYGRWCMDNALKQEFQDEAIRNGSYQNYNLSSDQVTADSGESAEEQESPNKPDEYSNLYVPLLLKYYRVFLEKMSQLSFPVNGDWLNIERSFSRYFYQTGIEDFLPFVNDAWVKIVKTENQRFCLKEKYEISIGESIKYGNTLLGHSYNPDSSFLEPFTPGIGQAGLWPISDDWRKSNLCFYYDVNYSELLSRTDFDQEVVANIRPSVETEQARTLAGEGATNVKEHREYNVPYGKVRLHDFFIPSLYVDSMDGKEPFVARNVYLTACIKPKYSNDSELEQKSVHILKVTQNVSPQEHGLLLGSFTTRAPGTFYQQGPIQPFLPHQFTANQFFSQISRMSAMLVDPPKNIESTNGSMLDPYETEIPAFEPSAGYVGMKIEPLIGSDFYNTLTVFQSFMNYFNQEVGEGIGIGKRELGSTDPGRQTKMEIIDSSAGTQTTLVQAATRWDEQILRPSISIRIKGEQDILKNQVQTALENVQEQPDINDEESAYETVLQENKLFQRMLDYSGIESTYKEFYKKVQSERIQDMSIAQEAMKLEAQIQQLLQFKDSPIPPPPQIPIQKDATTGLSVPSVEQIQQMSEAYFAGEQQKRQQAGEQAQQLEIERKIKVLTFKDVQEPPMPSNRLFYEMLTASVSDSDVIVRGALSAVSKELARENTVMFLQALNGIPGESLQKVDYDGLLMMLARANDIRPADILKSQADLLREEQQQQAQNQFQQQLQMQAASGTPGSQPAQFG